MCWLDKNLFIDRRIEMGKKVTKETVQKKSFISLPIKM